MKKTVRLFSIMAVIVAGCTTACGQNAIKNTANDSGKVKVMTSFYTMYDFAQKIGGEKVELNQYGFHLEQNHMTGSLLQLISEIWKMQMCLFTMGQEWNTGRRIF